MDSNQKRHVIWWKIKSAIKPKSREAKQHKEQQSSGSCLELLDSTNLGCKICQAAAVGADASRDLETVVDQRLGTPPR